MLYLAGQFSWFLLAAFVLACAMGWISQGERRFSWWSPAWSALAVIWGIGAALAWLQFVDGMAAIWIETALLFAAVYWVGCVCGGLLGSRFVSRAAALSLARTEPADDPALQDGPKSGEKP